MSWTLRVLYVGKAVGLQAHFSTSWQGSSHKAWQLRCYFISNLYFLPSQYLDPDLLYTVTEYTYDFGRTPSHLCTSSTLPSISVCRLVLPYPTAYIPSRQMIRLSTESPIPLTETMRRRKPPTDTAVRQWDDIWTLKALLAC
jgi:hypothetical protein